MKCPEKRASKRVAGLVCLFKPPLRATFSPARPSDCFAIDYPRRAIHPSEGSPRPRVARAQEVNSLHSLVLSYFSL